MREGVERRAARWLAAGVGPVWVVAVSGGGDSVGLLRALHEAAPGLGLRLFVAHLNHGVRGDAARADAAFVEALAGSLGLPCDLGRWAPTRGSHFEADARRARLAWLLDVARTRGANAVAVGHTRDDQAETVLHRAIRGTGLRGLAGIPARRALAGGISLVRPLLDVSRAEVRGYLDGLGQPYRDDASNDDLSRTRARIRHDLLPKLAAEYNPRAADALVRLASAARGAERAYRKQVDDGARAATATAGAGLVVLRRDAVAALPAFLRAEVLRAVWRKAGWPEGNMTASRWRRLAALLAEGKPARLDAGAGVHVEASSEFLTFHEMAVAVPAPGPGPVALGAPGSAAWPGGRIELTLDPAEVRDETIDLDGVTLPLRVRAPRAGDRFNPLGMGSRETPLNDFFRGRGVARERPSADPPALRRRGHRLGGRPPDQPPRPPHRRHDPPRGPPVAGRRRRRRFRLTDRWASHTIRRPFRTDSPS